jgi:EAL domain-containing protein (putative c-di-GMP-specific phosphodiesterase class I)
MRARLNRKRDPVNRGEENPLKAAILQRDSDTLAMVRRAVARQDVLLAFQPVISVARPDRPAFYEGLIRVLDASGRVIPAREFIDVVETLELGRQIDCLALSIGLQALLEESSLRLSINMSARSIGYPRWAQTLRKGLQSDPSLGERLILEITESSAMTMPDLVTVFMRENQKRGVSFALDDFGAGFTSFRYLRQFYFDIIKIDGQFIRGIHASPDNQVLTQALVSIGRHFDMFTVAESVETAEDAAFLTEIGVDCLQGYYYGAPTVVAPWKMPQARKRA